tara:strand:+ start:585 stop:1040 length:456 start_codon:yes stop_codon:yes gene_type:complete
MTTKRKGRKIVNAKKKVVDGITFQSILETQMYKLLKDANIKFGYESKVYNTLDGLQYPSECWERARKNSKSMIDRRKVLGVKYTPDFVAEDESWIIETKGRANESFPIRWKLFKKLLMSKSKNTPIIFKPTNLTDCRQVIEILLEKGYGQE